ncbi:MAG: putative membrane protein [Mesotoga prima]|uniref:Putative membrane protein n=1 Tax=Mesotoga prima TaxID=1184387 RepID=A0A117M2Q9_9BACT|nr:MAG: putative membrane protein [Mesotoga prima]
MKRKFERKYFFIIFMIVSGFFMFIALGNGFWRESAPYKIDSVEINARLNDQGDLLVEELSVYTLSRNNRTANKKLHLSYPSVLNSYSIEVSQGTGVVREISSSPGGFDARIFLEQEVTQFLMTTEYSLSGVVETGSDIAVLSYRFWEPNSDAMTRDISLSIELPEAIISRITKDDISVRPYKEARVEIEGNSVKLGMKSVLSNASGEIKISFPKNIASTMPNAVSTTVSKSSIRKEHEIAMFQQAFLSGLIGFQIAVPFFVLFFTFILFGVEPQVKSEIGYRIYDVPGYILNAVIRNPFQEVDHNGFLATILEMHNSGEIFIGENSISVKATQNGIPTQQQWALQTIKSLKRNEDGSIEIPDAENSSVSLNEFREHYSLWQKNAMRSVKSGRFYEYLGSTVMSVFSIFYLIIWSMILKFVFGNWQIYLSFPDESLVLSIVLYADWCLGWLLLVVPKRIFARWTPSGRLFYMEWKKSEKELLSKPSLSNDDLSKLVAMGHLQSLIANRQKVNKQQLSVLRQLQKLELLLDKAKS